MDELQARIEPILAPHTDSTGWLVGFSGGLDSTVLLHLLHDYLARRAGDRPGGFSLRAVHVHHGVNANADAWQRHCETFCGRRCIPLHVESVEVSGASGKGFEAAAREARYTAISSLQQPAEVLFLGHHLDDQLETLVLNLFRNRGIAGLGGMALASRWPSGMRLRPLLDTPREELLAYARRQALSWVEDESNTDRRYSRNFVRHRLLPVVEEHWPDYRPRLAATIRAVRDSSELLAELADEDLARAVGGDRWGQFLKLGATAGLSPQRLKNLVTHWLHRAGMASPRQRQWPVIFRDLLAREATDGAVLTLGGDSLRRYRQCLYLVRGSNSVQAGERSQVDRQRSSADLGAAGTLHLDPVEPGLERTCLDLSRSYEVRFRRGGERVRGTSWAHSKSLKHYLQEQGVPPWWRGKVPLLYSDGQLAAVADMCVCEGFQAPAAVPGGNIRWETGAIPSGA